MLVTIDKNMPYLAGKLGDYFKSYVDQVCEVCVPGISLGKSNYVGSFSTWWPSTGELNSFDPKCLILWEDNKK